MLKELLAEKLRLVLKRMDRTEYLRTLQEYDSSPGSSMTLVLNFSESQIEAEISVMKPTIISPETSTSVWLKIKNPNYTKGKAEKNCSERTAASRRFLGCEDKTRTLEPASDEPRPLLQDHPGVGSYHLEAADR